MRSAPRTSQEEKRLQALYDLDLLDTPPVEALDRLTRLAADVFDAPVCLLSLVDRDRVWFKSRQNYDPVQMDRDPWFCAYTILEPDPLVIPDVSRDSRFRSNPSVFASPPLLFYAGAPLTTSDGLRVGALCVLDLKPRPEGLSSREKARLADLSDVVMAELERHAGQNSRPRAPHARTPAAETDAPRSSTGGALQSVFYSAPLPMCTFDRQVRVSLWNRSAERIFGWSAGDLLGSTFSGSANATLQVLGAVSERICRGESVTALECQLSRRDGSTREVRLWGAPILSEGLPHGGMMVIRDITEEKRVHEELRSTSERYRLLFEKNPQAMYLYHRETLRVIAANPAAAELYGYPEDELLQLTIAQLRPEEDVPRMKQALSQARPGLNQWGIWRHRRKDGAIRHVDIRTHDLDFHGMPSRLALVVDVTERISIEQQLRQAQKMEAVGQLAGGIAHDFNNLLTVINGYAALIQQRLDPADPLRQEISYIANAGGRAATLTRQLLAFSRKQVLQPKLVNLNQILSDMQPLFRRLVRENIEVSMVLDPDLPDMVADASQIEQVLLNLIVNASDAMPDGGSLSIASTVVTGRPPTRPAEARPERSRYILLSVRDSGVGMDEATRSRIFEPFFTTKGTRGTGLGLATVYGIVSQSNGFIEVESEPNQGAAFRIYLPVAAAAAAAEQPADLPASQGRAAGSILLVEDDEGVRSLAAVLLRDRGYSVTTARNGPEALKRASNPHFQFDLLITDLVLPEMSGLTLASTLARLRPALRTLYMSGYSEAEAPEAGLPGGTPFLQKPFTREALLQKVEDALSQPKATRYILVVSDDEAEIEETVDYLQSHGYSVVTASHATASQYRGADLILAGSGRYGGSGGASIRHLQQQFPLIPIAILAADTRDLLALQRTLGVRDILELPVTPTRLLATVRRLLP